MKAANYFSQDYHSARTRFLEASSASNAQVENRACPAPGPEGERLHCDVAWHGRADAPRVLVTISATHGVEGFCGSGPQCGWLESGLYREMPDDTALLQIHAINPHGFAWLRRVTEDNVDLNRNFVEHGGAYPANPGYEALKEAICPAEWNDSVIAETQQVLDAYAAEKGPRALQSALSGGQYGHAEGIFFGGNSPTWSRDQLLAIFRERLARARHVAVIDYHTGLGPYGYGERICVHPADSDGLARARDWYSEDVTSPYLGNSSSVELCGFNVLGMEQAVPEAATLTAVALEYGTLPSPEVRLALRADNWLHVHSNPKGAKGQIIKAQIRAAFYQDQDDWKEMIWERAVETQRLAIQGLAAL